MPSSPSPYKGEENDGKGRKTTALLSWFPSCGQPLILSTPVLSLSKGITEHLQSSPSLPSVILDISNRGSRVFCMYTPRHSMAPPPGACGRGYAPVPNSIWGRGLFERSEFRSPHPSGLGQRHQEGHARAPLVLGPFAETPQSSPASRGAATPQVFLPQVARGRNPARASSPFCHPGLDPGSRAFVFCSCSRAISWRFLLGRMRCGRYKYREARWTAKACPGA